MWTGKKCHKINWKTLWHQWLKFDQLWFNFHNIVNDLSHLNRPWDTCICMRIQFFLANSIRSFSIERFVCTGKNDRFSIYVCNSHNWRWCIHINKSTDRCENVCSGKRQASQQIEHFLHFILTASCAWLDFGNFHCQNTVSIFRRNTTMKLHCHL